MSRYLKNLITNELATRLQGVEDAVLVNVIGMSSINTVSLRRELRDKKIHLLVVKNSLARRAAESTRLAHAFDGAEGSLAVVWGSEDFISLTKEITRLAKSGKYEKFETRGGVMDGEKLTAERVEQISKWPNRQEMLSILSGQILSPGAQLSSQLLGPGGLLVSQLDKKSEAVEGQAPAEAT
jgi:ribosomal protein L10